MTFTDELRQQRWDDHRYYHHSRINQSLHLLSSVSFLSAYGLLIVSPQIAAVVGWVIAMWSRQIGHFFFEPKTYDTVNQATHEHKEAIKIGYNLHRKVVLMSLWALSPLLLAIDRTFLGVFEHHQTFGDFMANLAIVWLVLGAGGLVFRTVHLFFLSGVQTGLVWATKILTDPFNDFRMYCKSPFYLMKGELIDPMEHVVEESEEHSQRFA